MGDSLTTMRAILFFIWAGLLLGSSDSAASFRSWTSSFGGSKKDALHSVVQRPNGSFVGVGKTFSTDGDLRGLVSRGGQDAWLVRLDFAGQLLSSRNFGGAGNDVFAAVTNTPAGGYVVVGSAESSYGDKDVWVLKFSAKEELLWERHFGGASDDLGMAVLSLADGSIFVGADSLSAANGHHGCAGGHRDFWLLKLDQNGNKLWDKSYGGTNHEYLSQIIATSDGNFALGGRTESSDGDVSGFMGEYDGWVVKIDPAGSILWEKVTGGEMWDWGSNLAPTKNGGVLFSGYTFSWDGDGSGNKGDYDYFLVSFDAGGKRLWHKTYGGAVDDFAQGLAALPDGTFVVTGGSVSHDGDVPENRGNFDLWAIRVSDTGRLLWSRTFGGSAYDISTTGGSDYYEASPGGALTNTRDGGLVMAGASKSADGDVPGNPGGFDSWVVKWSPEEWKTEKVKARRGQEKKLRAAKVVFESAPQKAPAIEWSRVNGEEPWQIGVQVRIIFQILTRQQALEGSRIRRDNCVEVLECNFLKRGLPDALQHTPRCGQA